MVRSCAQHCLSMLAFDPYAVLDGVCAKHFPHRKSPALVFQERRTLAGIHKMKPVIEVHVILNTPELPEWVFRHIMIHEMIHLDIAGREVDGRWSAHPPEFWEVERALSHDREKAMDWIKKNYDDFIVLDPDHERLNVRRTWRAILRQKSAAICELTGGRGGWRPCPA